MQFPSFFYWKEETDPATISVIKWFALAGFIICFIALAGYVAWQIYNPKLQEKKTKLARQEALLKRVCFFSSFLLQLTLLISFLIRPWKSSSSCMTPWSLNVRMTTTRMILWSPLPSLRSTSLQSACNGESLSFLSLFFHFTCRKDSSLTEWILKKGFCSWRSVSQPGWTVTARRLQGDPGRRAKK